MHESIYISIDVTGALTVVSLSLLPSSLTGALGAHNPDRYPSKRRKKKRGRVGRPFPFPPPTSKKRGYRKARRWPQQARPRRFFGWLLLLGALAGILLTTRLLATHLWQDWNREETQGEETFFDPYENSVQRHQSFFARHVNDQAHVPTRKVSVDHGPGTGNETSQELLDFFQESYIARLPTRAASNANPNCSGTISRYFRTLRWQPTDLSAEARRYLSNNVLMALVTGNYDDYSRIKIARCTWLGHMPEANVFFVTDSLYTPQDAAAVSAETRELYEHGHWFATEDWSRATSTDTSRVRALNERFINGAAYRVNSIHYQRPAAWFAAQLRFFDSFDVMFHHMLHQVDTTPFPHARNYHRWFSVLDDDSYVSLDGLAAVLHYHQLRTLYTRSGEAWWRLILDDYIARLKKQEQRLPAEQLAALSAEAIEELRRLLGTPSSSAAEGAMTVVEAEVLNPPDDVQSAKQAWQQHCVSIEERVSLQRGTALYLPNFSRDECERYPRRMADLAWPFLSTYPTGEAQALRELAHGRSRGKLVQRMARLYSNALSFIGDPLDLTAAAPDTYTVDKADAAINSTRVVGVFTPQQRAALVELWSASDALLDPAWVQLYHMPAEKLYYGARGGAGHHLNARAFYFHFMHTEKLNETKLTWAQQSVEARFLEAERRFGKRTLAKMRFTHLPLVPKKGVPAVDIDTAAAHLAYPYVFPCIDMGIRLDKASDQAMCSCLSSLGITQLHDATFREHVAFDMLRSPPKVLGLADNEEDSLLRYDRVPYRCRNRLLARRCLFLNETVWDLFTADDVIHWTTLHVKMELLDHFRQIKHKPGHPLISVAYDDNAPMRQRQFKRFERFKMQLYYEATYTPTPPNEEGGNYTGERATHPVSHRAVAARLLERIGTPYLILEPAEWQQASVCEPAERRFQLFLRLAGDGNS